LIIVLILVTLSFTFNASGPSHPSLSQNAAFPDWPSWASVAWNYFQPGVGVSPNTGLERATLGWHCFTDWDLGSYVYSIIDARKLALIPDGNGAGDWNFLDRINKVLAFLQTRPLTSNGGVSNWPYSAYEWNTSPYAHCTDTGSTPLDAADAGRLLAALYALKTYRPTYASTVDAIFNRSKSAYDKLAAELASDYYGYAIAEGYAAFGYDASRWFAGIDNYTGSVVSVYGQDIPKIKTTSEPILLMMLEADTIAHPPSAKFISYADAVYNVQRNRYLKTGQLTAWSEGAYGGDPAAFIYEWVLYPAKTTEQWVVGDSTLTTTYTLQPLAYTKVSFAFLSIYGENQFTLALVNAALELATAQDGFGEGSLENGNSGISLWKNSDGFYSSGTNYFILASANHYGHSISASISTGLLPTMITAVSLGRLLSVRTHSCEEEKRATA
jgi:hypothetical protein